MPLDLDTVELLGLRFTCSPYVSIRKALDRGVFMVVPSGPGLATIEIDKRYYCAIRRADFAIFDSGFFVLLCRIFGLGRFRKYSGYAFLRDFLTDASVMSKKLLLVDPNDEQSEVNRAYLRSQGFRGDLNSYVAPMYGAEIADENLQKKIEQLRPDIVIINLGGGVQEILGAWLTDTLTEPPSIVCTGAAIAFFTGKQAPINDLLDRLYLGWFVRVIHSPRLYWNRYLAALGLVKVVWRWKAGDL